jgi:outer membrane immunogenic protein
MHRVRFSLLAAVAVIGFASMAHAADMAVKAPPPPSVVAPAYSWTGCYIGGNGGYAWNNSKSNYQDPNAVGDPINGLGLFSTIPTPNNTSSSGWLGGGEVGCNWQMDRRLVLGIEADIDALRASGNATTFGPGPDSEYQVSPVNFIGGAGTASEEVSLRWLSTIRARAGLPVLADRGLLFATGGLALGRVSSSGSLSVNGVGILTDTWAGSNSSTQTGYTVGGGFEYAVTDHWTTKVEYLYYDVGNASHPLNLIANNVGAAVYPTLGNTVSPIRGSMIRVGLNYQFTWGPGH